MADIGIKMIDDTAKGVSRRNFIKESSPAAWRSPPRTISSAPPLFLGQPAGERGRAAHHAQREWPAAAGRRDEAGDAGLDPALQAGLTGTKLGCDRAECGACTVLIDDVPHYSCSVLTHTVRGRKVQTIEGLASA